MLGINHNVHGGTSDVVFEDGVDSIDLPCKSFEQLGNGSQLLLALVSDSAQDRAISLDVAEPRIIPQRQIQALSEATRILEEFSVRLGQLSSTCEDRYVPFGFRELVFFVEAVVDVAVEQEHACMARFSEELEDVVGVEEDMRLSIELPGGLSVFIKLQINVNLTSCNFYPSYRRPRNSR